MRLIDADVLIKDITENVIEVSGDSGLAEEAVKCYQAVILKYIDTMPTINPEDCRPQGRWRKRKNERACSNCKFIYYSNNDEWNYCPNCGAKMDGKEHNNA